MDGFLEMNREIDDKRQEIKKERERERERERARQREREREREQYSKY